MSKINDLWINFPQNFLEFEQKFPTDEACRNYLIELRWNGRPRCHCCNSRRVYELSTGRWECSACGHQTSITVGTPMEGTRKPLRMWFRAIWEVVSRKNGISAKDLQRIMGFGSYKTAWSWLHKIRRCLVRPTAEPLQNVVQVDEGFIGGRKVGERKFGSTDKSVVFVAAEADYGRIRLEHAPNNDGPSATDFFERQIALDATVVTDGGGMYQSGALGSRKHKKYVQTAAERKKNDPVQRCHWTLAGLKRWLLGTHHGAIGSKHLQSYLDEFTFRHNRRHTKGVGRLVARVFENLITTKPIPMKEIIHETIPCSRFIKILPESTG